jgi:hypothetical protein
VPESSIAQTTPQLEQLQVNLWPEHDWPDMLVIYRGTLPADTPLPATLTLRLPARIGEPHAVAYADENGTLLQANYSTTTTGDWLEVTLETPKPNFHLEFYDDLDRTGDQRDYTFVWPGDYAVDQLSILLLPPPDTTEIQTRPALSPVQQDDGSLVYTGMLGSFAAGQEARLTLSYRSTSTSGLESNAPLVAGAVGVLLLVIVSIVWYTHRSAPEPAKAKSPQRRSRRSQGRRRRAQSQGRPSGKILAQDKSSPAGYCTHCGRALRADDRFCGHCGTPVKRNTDAQS